MDRTAVATDGTRPVIRILSSRGWLRVRPCPLCAALVVVNGDDRHEKQHAADARRVDEIGQRAVALVDALIAAVGRDSG